MALNHEMNLGAWLWSEEHRQICKVIETQSLTGIGQPKEGAIADMREQRVRVYPNTILRAKVKSEFPSVIELQPLGLPAEYFPLLAPGRKAFIREGEQIVAHGGISVEELVVPFIHVAL